MTVAPRLLIVEDNPQLSSILRLAFEFQGFQVEEANHGQEALDLCHDEEHHFDLVLMDLQMPVMDGLTAAGLLRAHPLTRETVIICLSANLDTVENPLELKRLFDASLRKPVSPRELVKQAAGLLAERNLPQAH